MQGDDVVVFGRDGTAFHTYIAFDGIRVARPEVAATGIWVRRSGDGVTWQPAVPVSLIDQGVRAPHSAALLMHTDPEREIIQVTVTNREVEGYYIRDLRLPSDILFLDISRNGHSIVPSGYVHLHLHDEVTLLGKPHSLQEVTLRLGY